MQTEEMKGNEDETEKKKTTVVALSPRRHGGHSSSLAQQRWTDAPMQVPEQAPCGSSTSV